MVLAMVFHQIEGLCVLVSNVNQGLNKVLNFLHEEHTFLYHGV